MKLEWIRCFIAVAENGSINKAAEKLYLSQPAVTKMMQALERELAIELLQRRKTGVALTAHGELFLPYAKKILREYNIYLTEKKKIENQHQIAIEKIELVISSVIMQTYYKTIEKAMKNAFPSLKIYFVEADAETAFPLILENKRMFGLLGFDASGIANIPDSWKVETVYQSPVICCMNKESGYEDFQILTEDMLSPGMLIGLGFSKKHMHYMQGSKYNLYTVNLDLVRATILKNENACVLLPQCIAEKLFQPEEVCFMKFMPQQTVTFGFVYNRQAMEEGVLDDVFLRLFKRTLQNVLAV